MTTYTQGGIFRSFKSDGTPNISGFVYTYAAGTLTPLATYVTPGGSANANPVALGVDGAATICLTDGVAYRFRETTSTALGGVLIKDTDNIVSNSAIADLSSSAVGKGSKLVAWILRATGAVAGWVEDRLSEEIGVFDFMTEAQRADWRACNASIDVTAAIQAAIDYAYTSVITQTTFDDYGYHSRGGAVVKMPRGKGLVSGQLTLRPGVSLKGAGGSSSAIYATYNGKVFQVAPATKSGEYNQIGIELADFMLIGLKTQALQIGFDLMRPVGLRMDRITINSCGKNGLVLREVSNSHFVDLEIANCAGAGMIVTEGSAGLPSNLNTFINPRILYNDGDGIVLTGQTNGSRFIGGSSERNGYATAGVGFYNIRDESNNYQANTFDGVWTEGPCKAHVYVNHTASSGVTRLINWPHFADGAAVLPERALIVDMGTVYVHHAIGSAVNYKTVAGSNAPFRVNKTNAIIYVEDCTGSLASGLGFVEDETGLKTGLYNPLKQRIPGANFGPMVLYNDNGATDGLEGRTDTLATYPWFQFQAAYKRLMFGIGTAAPDAGIERKAVGVVGAVTGSSIQVGGINGETLKFNAGTANAAVAVTFTGVGPTGSTAGPPQGWLRINVNGTDRYTPYW